MQNPILVALDVPEASTAVRLAERLAPAVGGFKIGSELFTAAGPEIVGRIRALGAPVFLDLKFHDIPNTVANAVSVAVGLDVQMLTVHTSGGRLMLEAAERAAQEAARKMGKAAPLVLGVTVLTSLDDGQLAELGLAADAGGQVERLARLGVQAGLRGLVCSPLEISRLRGIIPSSVQLVTPGIRLTTDSANDQKRTLSAREAIQAGASWLVIGRPICAAADPVEAARKILASIEAT